MSDVDTRREGLNMGAREAGGGGEPAGQNWSDTSSACVGSGEDMYAAVATVVNGVQFDVLSGLFRCKTG